MKQILFIEDEKLIRDIYQTKFSEIKDIEVFTVITPDEAEKVLLEERIDLIILDILLPKQDGLSYLKKLKKNGVNIAVIIFSNLEGESYRKIAKALGVKEYILKTDYIPSEILEIVKKYL